VSDLKLTSAAAAGGELWWIWVGGGDPQPDPAGGLADRSRERGCSVGCDLRPIRVCGSR
jgi:hypothetical protein